MIPFAILLLVAGFVLVWTGFRGDGSGGFNPAALVSGSLSKQGKKA